MKKNEKSQEEQILDEMEAVQKSYDEVNEVLNQEAETKEQDPSSPQQEHKPTPEEIKAGGMLTEDPAPDAADQGVVADNYKDVPKLKVDANQDQDEDHGDGIDLKYGFTGQEAKEALKVFQRYTIRKRYMIYFLILAVLLIFYLYNIIFQNGSQVSMFIAVVCIAVMCFIVYLPHSHIKHTVSAIDANPYTEDYEMTVYQDGIRMGSGENANFVPYGKKNFRCWETEDLFIIGHEKQRVFILPKRCCPEEVMEPLIQRMKEGFGEAYQEVTGKK